MDWSAASQDDRARWLVAVVFGLTRDALGGVALDTRYAILMAAGPATLAMVLSSLRVDSRMSD